MKTTLLSDITARLASTSDSPALDASVLIAYIIHKPRTWVVARPDLTLTGNQQKQLDEALAQLEGGKPLPYLLGRWEFFGLDFDITPNVLIPRPETELLVEKAIAWLKQHPDQRSVADVGTGSGAIAVSLAVNMPDIKILATDISSKALQVARQNAEKHKVIERISFVECDLLPGQSSIDLICANLPYIPTKIVRTLPIYNQEPAIALDGGEDGFETIRKLMKMSPNSTLLLEIEATLGEQAIQLAHDIFPKAAIQLHKDLTGRDRLLEIEP